MATLQLIDPAKQPDVVGYPVPGTLEARGVRAQYSELADFGMFVGSARLEVGATVEIGGAHGESGIVVLDGRLDVDGLEAPSMGAVIVEADARVTIRAVTPARILHVGSLGVGAPVDGDYGPPRGDDHGVHVMGEEGIRVTNPAEGFEISHYADSGCPTCRIALFRVRGDGPTVAPSHSHSSPELITITEGELHVGPVTATAGCTLAIAGGRRYGFRTDCAYEFVNYRPDVSYITTRPGVEPRLEAGPLRM